MKKENNLLCQLVAAVLACLCFSGYAAKGEEADLPENRAEWTVLFYMCGSDLETRYRYGSDNLREIAACGHLLPGIFV